MSKLSLYTYMHEGMWEVWNTEAEDGWYKVRRCLGKFLTGYHAELFIKAWKKAECIAVEDEKRQSRNEWSELKLYDLMGGRKRGLSLSTQDAINAFCNSNKNYERPLCLLELAFKQAGLKIDFIGLIEYEDGIGYKTVRIVRDDCKESSVIEISIENDSPAMAVKKIAEGVGKTL